MKGKIAIIEFTDEYLALKKYLQDNKLDEKEYKIIAIEPKVQSDLLKKQVNFENTLGYFGNNSHKNCLLKTEKLYQLMKKNINLIDNTPVKEGYGNFILYHGLYYLHHYIKIIEILNNILQKNKPVELLASISNIKTNSHTITEERERYLGLLTKQIAEKNNIKFTNIPFERREIEKSYKKSFFGKNICKFYEKIIQKRLRDKKTILLTTTTYNFDLLAKEIKKQIPDVKIIAKNNSPISIKKYLKNIVASFFKKERIFEIYPHLYFPNEKNISADRRELTEHYEKFLEILKKHQNQFTYYKVDFYGLFKQKMQNGIRNGLEKLQMQTIAMGKILDRIKPEVIISPYSREIDRVLAEIGDSKKIPSIVIPHGTLAPPKNDLHKIDNYHIGLCSIINGYQYKCLQTPLATEYVKHYDISGKVIETGNLIFSKTQSSFREEIRKELIGAGHEKIKVIVHASTLKRRNTYFHWVENFDEMISSLKDIIHSIEKLENVHLIIKLHPAIKLSEEELKIFLPKSEKYSVIQKKPFYQVLSAADLYIGYSSTAIEDALQNNIPILLYDKWDRYMHCDAEKIAEKIPPISPIYYLNDAEKLTKILSFIFKNQNIKKIPKKIMGKYVFVEDKNHNFVNLLKKCVK